ANHNRVATASLVDCGLNVRKAVAWDYPRLVGPDDFAVKLPPAGGDLTVLFAGAVTEDKGATDVVRAGEEVRSRGVAVRLTILGNGPARSGLLNHPGVREGWLDAPGLLSNDQVFERMRECWVVVVPSRPAFPEALPLVILEALTARTPVVLSDHPVF